MCQNVAVKSKWVNLLLLPGLSIRPPDDAAAESHSGVLSKQTAVEGSLAASVDCFPEAKGDYVV